MKGSLSLLYPIGQTPVLCRHPPGPLTLSLTSLVPVPALMERGQKILAFKSQPPVARLGDPDKGGPHALALAVPPELGWQDGRRQQPPHRTLPQRDDGGVLGLGSDGP